MAEEQREEEIEQTGDELEPVEMLGRDETRQAIGALLFASDRPLSIGRIAEALGDIDPDIVANLMQELREDIDGRDLPFTLTEIAGGYQFVTKPPYAPYVRRLFQIKRSRQLSKAILETLAIIAYKQPVTRAEVESIRGVSVSYAFESLQEKRLIRVVGVAELPGRPKLYRTTDEFLIHFGLKTLKELPSIEELREMS
jgi:segregation and condensation protein B